MIYPDNFEHKLGFDKIRRMLKESTLCPLGAQRVDDMQFVTDRRTVEHQLALLSEMKNLIEQASDPLPTDNFYDLREPLKRIRIVGMFLEVEELWNLMRSLRTIEALKRYLSSYEGIPLLKSLAEQVIPFPDVTRRIDQTLTPTGEIRDNASPALSEIRREMSRNMSQIGRLLNGILRNAQAEGWVEKDTTPAIRDGRLVIPIPPSSKRKLRGIVHDESATGKTLYVEPAEVVEANNRIRELESEERQEIIRILTALTGLIRPEIDNMLADYDFLGEIDFLRAKVRFAQSIDATIPTMSEDNVTDWVQARHPLLYLRYKRENFALPLGEKPKSVVPLDILLNHKEQRIVLISGPNAGGKSVCLETLGLVQYMLQCGLAVPMQENSYCAVFDNIFMDIGDEQSIDNDLSTYSSHLQNMKFFVRNAVGYRKPKHHFTGSNGTMVLIDEFGSGTEPQIGGAIAQALLHRLNNEHVQGVITTHFTNLKLFADNEEGIRNGAMLYDRGEMRPLFRLEVGRPGSSFAIEIANKIGLPHDVIEEAKQIVGSDYVNMDKYLQDISRDKRYWEQKRQKVHQQEKELEEKKGELDTKLGEIKQKRQEVMEKARNEASTLLQQANARIEKTIKDIKEAQAEKEATRRIRAEHEEFKKKRLEQQQQQKPKATQSQTTPPLGETVKGSSSSSKWKTASWTIGQTASPTANKPKNSATDVIHDRRLTFNHEIDVRGMRAEEAIQAVMLYIDDVIALGISEVRILHGTGTGALRQAIRQYLGTVPEVADYHDEHVQFGGSGITVVKM